MQELPKYEDLKKPLPFYHYKNIYYQIIKLFLKTLGNTSNGIKILNETGYDSSETFEYISSKKTGGKYGIGFVIDFIYLNLISWRAARNRTNLINEFVKNTISYMSTGDRSSKIKVLDIACVSAKGLIDNIKKNNLSEKVSLGLRDKKLSNIEKARKNASEAGIKEVGFRVADAYDANLFTEKRDVIISSGLWESNEDDESVRRSLMNLSRALNPGGSLIFTFQPYHPHIERIARTLKNSGGDPMYLKLRDYELFQKWMKDAGLEVLSFQMEKKKIFGVVEARKK